MSTRRDLVNRLMTEGSDLSIEAAMKLEDIWVDAAMEEQRLHDHIVHREMVMRRMQAQIDRLKQGLPMLPYDQVIPNEPPSPLMGPLHQG